MGKTPEELRAIDAMVEGRIMGRKPILFGHSYRSAGTWLSYPPDNLEAEGVIVPNYTTDIAAAWSVRAAMEAKGFESEDRLTWMGWGGKHDHPYGYSIWFKVWPDRHEPDAGCDRSYHHHVKDHKDAPLAICLAALSALGAKA